MKLHLVSTGIYSDYQVRGIFSTPEGAAHARDFYNTENEIEEFELDALPEHPAGTFLFSVDMQTDGTVLFNNREEPSPKKERCWPGYNDSMKLLVWAKDKEGAVKVANERRLMMIASSSWIPDWKTWDALRTRVELGHLDEREGLWMDWFEVHGASDTSIRAFLEKYPPE